MSLNLVRRRAFHCPLALLLALSFVLGAVAPAFARQAQPGGGIKTICKPPPMCFANQAAKDQWAKDNKCQFLDDVCSGKTPDQDKDGASDADQGFWGDLWSGVKGALVYGYEFVKGLLVGLKDQVMDLVHMITNIDEVVGGLVQLGKAFFDDPKGTLVLMGDMLGQEALDTITKATQCGAYDLGNVIGSYVSPAFALKMASKLTKYSGKLGEVAKAFRKDFGCASFAAGTPVLTGEGLLAIELIRPGQMVASRNENSFADRPQKVVDTMGRVAPSYRLLRTEQGEFKVTGEHPLWVQGKGWTEAERVAEDDVIAGENGDLLVQANEAVAAPLRVYNFTVANTSNYFVGRGGMWAHNAGPCSIELYTKAWKKLTSKQKGFRAEREVFVDMKNRGYEPVGKSFNPSGKSPDAAFKEWDGQTGIDGLYKDKAGNYVIVESKATGGTKMADPDGCVAKLCTMQTGERQMSEKWIKDRLDKLEIPQAEQDKILAGMKDGSTKRIYAQTDANGTSYHEINEPTVGNVKIGGVWTPPPVIP